MTSRIVIAAAALLLPACASSEMSVPQRRFATPEDALYALAEDAEDPEQVRALIAERVDLEEIDPDRSVARIGVDAWEVPIPLVRDGDGWRFDVEAGREEIRSRRVGGNELRAIDTLHELVEAQRDFRASRGSSGPPAYAARWSSDGDHRDGLHWISAESEPESPVGPCFCSEDKEVEASCSAPLHGYCYRLLLPHPRSPGRVRERRHAQLPRREGPLVPRLRVPRVAHRVRRDRRHDLPGERARHRLREGPGPGDRARGAKGGGVRP